MSKQLCLFSSVNTKLLSKDRGIWKLCDMCDYLVLYLLKNPNLNSVHYLYIYVYCTYSSYFLINIDLFTIFN